MKVNKSQAFKTVFLGDSNVGKTCLAKLYVDRAVHEQSTNTIGFDHHVKEVETEEGESIKVGIGMSFPQTGAYRVPVAWLCKQGSNNDRH